MGLFGIEPCNRLYVSIIIICTSTSNFGGAKCIPHQRASITRLFSAIWIACTLVGNQENRCEYKHNREVADPALRSCREHYEERLAAQVELNPKD